MVLPTQNGSRVADGRGCPVAASPSSGLADWYGACARQVSRLVRAHMQGTCHRQAGAGVCNNLSPAKPYTVLSQSGSLVASAEYFLDVLQCLVQLNTATQVMLEGWHPSRSASRHDQ